MSGRLRQLADDVRALEARLDLAGSHVTLACSTAFAAYWMVPRMQALREQLPGFMRVISEFLPLTAAVELIRPLFMDQWPEHSLRHLAVLLVYAVGGFWVALALTRKRFKG